MSTIGYQIEMRNKKTGCPIGVFVDRRTAQLTLCRGAKISLPTRQAAKAYAEEFGLVVGHDVLITEHEWVDD